MDSISALMGLEAQEDEKMRMLADRLRGEQQAGQIFSMSQIPGIGDVAAQHVQDVNASAQQAGLARAKELDRLNQKKIADERNKASIAAAIASAGLDPSTEAYLTARAGADSDALDSIFDQSGVAEGLLTSLDSFAAVMSGVEDTGLLAGFKTDLGRLGASFGMEVDPDVPQMEAARAITNQIALRLRNPESGMGLTGNTSDRDVRFLLAAVPRIENSEEGNAILIDMWGRIQRRQIEKARQAAEYESRHGRFSRSDFDREWRTYVDANPLFEDLESVWGGEEPTPDGFVPDD
jgi:hypothetical protein